MARILQGVVAVVAALGGTIVLFWALNKLVEALTPAWEHRLKPYVFVGPAIFVVAVIILFPAISTIYLSFFDARSVNFVGFDNYVVLAVDPTLRSAIINNLLWIIVVPSVSVAVGLLVAVLSDRLKPTTEKLTKSVIFMPMAISFVGASTIWGFIYVWRPEGQNQIGLLNSIWTALGGEPQTWLQISTLRLNSFLLMIILIWLQAGFAMVLLSAAIKNVPEDTLEAARIDGANEIQIFFRVIVPQIASTIMVVLTTIVILVLKVFDVVFVLTGGRFDTDLVAVRFIRELFTFREFGRAAAIVVVLMLATIPVMIYNIRQFREQEAAR
jgi:alpha-glucoside transport system permease protein